MFLQTLLARCCPGMNSKPQPRLRYIHRETGESFTLRMGKKLSADNEQVDVYQLRSDRHYFECSNEAELQKFFVKL